MAKGKRLEEQVESQACQKGGARREKWTCSWTAGSRREHQGRKEKKGLGLKRSARLSGRRGGVDGEWLAAELLGLQFGG